MEHERQLVQIKSMGRGVTFASHQEEVHVGKGGTHKVVNALSAAAGTKTGNRNSKSAARRRRFWRRVWRRMSPRWWAHWLNKNLPVVMPNTRLRLCWDGVIAGMVMYNALIVPYEVGFTTPAPHILDVVTWIITVFFAMDIGYNFRTAYVDETARLIRDGSKIATHYLRTWFTIDLCSTFPFEAVILGVSSGLNNSQLAALALLRTPRLLRLVRLLRMLDRIKYANFVRLLKLLLFMSLVAHWITCLWHLLFKVLSTNGSTWTFDQLGSNSAEITYFLNGYLNTFLLMIGNDVVPQNDIERVFCTFVLISGACFYAIVIGNMSLLINNLNPTASRHKLKKDIVNNAIRYLGTPAPLAKRINGYFEYLTTHSHPGADGMALVGQLPSSMSQQINSWMYREQVVQVPLFKDCEEAFITHLVMRLRMGVYLPGEVIFRIGDVGREMYFITKGNVVVLNAHSEMLAVLTQGGFFGELALLATARRTAQCVAVAPCDLALLMANDLVAAMRNFPDSAAKVRGRALNRLNELQAAGNVAEQADDTPLPAHLRKIIDYIAGPAEFREGGDGGAEPADDVVDAGGDERVDEGGVVQRKPSTRGQHLQPKPPSTPHDQDPSSNRPSCEPDFDSAHHGAHGFRVNYSAQGPRADLSALNPRGAVKRQASNISRSSGGGADTGEDGTPRRARDPTKLMRHVMMAVTTLSVRSKNRGGARAKDLEPLSSMMSKYRTRADWFEGMLGLVAQVHTSLTSSNAKLDSLGGRIEVMDGRIAKVEVAAKADGQQGMDGLMAPGLFDFDMD